ncbi:G2/mitotic-specific cyclin cdc13 [Yarrowia sp. B02]|nr:G2/mitotic-specific cyclin cdc13 [Yarrowia sp. B02]
MNFSRNKMTGLRDENMSASTRLPRAKTAEPSAMDISIGDSGAPTARSALGDLSNVGLSANVFKHTAASQNRRALTSKTTNGTATNKPAVKATFSASVAGLSRTRQASSNNSTQRPSTLTRAATTAADPYMRPQRASLQTKSMSADFNIPIFQSKAELPDLAPVTRKRPSQGAKDMEMPRLAARGGKHHQTMETFAYREEGPLAKKHKQEEDKAALALEAEQQEVIRRPLIQVLAPGATGVDVEHDDLDAEDIDDPMAAGEYVDEIFTHLYDLEEEYQPNPRYIDDQKSLSWNTRAVLVDWLVEVHQKFRLLPETLFLAVNIVDRFMSRRVVALNKVQLVGITSLLLATKYEEVFTPALSNFVYVVDGSYPEDEILRAERFILQVLQFNLSYPNPMNFLRRISKADDFDIHSRTFGKYLCEIALVDHTFMEFKHSLVAAAAMHVGRMMLARSQWTNNLVYYSGGYTQKDIAPVCRKIFQFLIGPVEHEAFFKKYATKKFLKASIIAREWALGVQEQIKNGVNSYETNLFI